MRYYEKVLQSGEHVRCIGRIHWFVYGPGMLWGVLAVASLVAVIGRPPDIIAVFPVVLLLFSSVSLLRAWFVRATTEIVVTDKRVIHKIGWIGRRTQEINISKVETVDVTQGVWGRIFDFGAVLIRGTGSTWQPLSQVAEPLALRNAIVVG